MRFTLTKSSLAFIFFSFVGLTISVIGVFVLPERFLSDGQTILNVTPGLIGSYAFTGWFYKVTKLGELHYSIIGFIQFLIAMFILYKIGIPKKFDRLTLKNILIYLSILIVGLFLGMPTKEFINIIYISFIVLLFKNRKRSLFKTILIALLLISFFGYFFRSYYYLAALLMVVFYTLSFIKIKNKRFASIVFSLLITIGISLSYGIVKGNFLTEDTREKINKERAAKEHVNTIIQSPIDTDKWYGESFSIIYGFFTVNLPVNGLKHFLSPHILAFIIWELLLFYLLYIEYGKCIKEGRKGNYDIWLFYFLFSYLIIQGIFEPDLGSAVRHKAGFFPVIYYLLYYKSFREPKT